MAPFFQLLLFTLAIGLSNGGDDEGLKSEYFDELRCPKGPIPLFPGKVNYAWVRPRPI